MLLETVTKEDMQNERIRKFIRGFGVEPEPQLPDGDESEPPFDKPYEIFRPTPGEYK